MLDDFPSLVSSLRGSICLPSLLVEIRARGAFPSPCEGRKSPPPLLLVNLPYRSTYVRDVEEVGLDRPIRDGAVVAGLGFLGSHGAIVADSDRLVREGSVLVDSYLLSHMALLLQVTSDETAPSWQARAQRLPWCGSCSRGSNS